MVSGVDGARRTGTPSTGAPSATPPIRGAFRIRWRARWRGVLARTRLLADVHAVLLLMRSVATRSRARSLESLLTACRRATWRPVRSVLRRRIAPLLQSPASSVWQEHGVGIERYYGSFADIRDLTLTSSVVLKAPGSNGEKGVLYSSFEYNWLRIAKSPGALEFFRSGLLDWREDGDHGVVHPDANWAECLFNPCCGCFDLVGVGHIGLNGQRLST